MFFKDTFKKYFDEKLIFIIFTIFAMVYLSLKLLINGVGLIFLFYFFISLLTSLIFREACLSDEIYFEDKKNPKLIKKIMEKSRKVKEYL